MVFTITNRDHLLGELIDQLKRVNNGTLPYVCADIRHVYAHFFNEGGEDIGNLCAADALDALWNDIYIWVECSTECDDFGTPLYDLDLREATSVELKTH